MKKKKKSKHVSFVLAEKEQTLLGVVLSNVAWKCTVRRYFEAQQKQNSLFPDRLIIFVWNKISFMAIRRVKRKK